MPSSVQQPAYGDGEPGAAGAHRLVEVDGHPADRVDELLERREVDLHVVVDRDAEVLLDRLDEALRGGRPVALERLVDAALRVRAGDGDPQVARERQQPGGRVLRVEPQHHDRVGAGPGDGAATPGHGVIGVEAGVVVRADEQVVHRRPGRTVLGLAEGVAAELDPGDVAELVVEVGEGAGGAERADDADDVEEIRSRCGHVRWVEAAVTALDGSGRARSGIGAEAQLAADHEALDLARALADLEDLGVAVVPRDSASRP